MLSPVNHSPTKKAFKDAIKSGKDIFFSDPSIFDNYAGYLSDLPTGKMFYVVGPSAYDRKWYANFIKRADGTIKVS